MRVDCGCPAKLASSTLVDKLKTLGVQPIVTPSVIRAVYEGPNRSVGEAIVEIFAHEADHDITVDYTEAEQRRSARRAMRKAERDAWNVRLHGH